MTEATMARETSAVEIKAITENDAIALHQFYVAEFAHIPKLTNQALWEWEFLRHPESQGKPLFFALQQDQRICGAIGGLPATLSVQGEHHPACHPVDFFVTEQCKGLPALRLFRKMLAERPVHYASYVSDDAEKLFTAAGFLQLNSHIQNYYYGLKPDTSPAPVKARLRRLAIACIRSLLLNWTHLKGLLTNRGGYTYPSSDQLNPDWVPDLPSQDTASRIKILKSTEYLRWRYQDSPNLSCRYFAALRDHQPHCLLVIHADNVNKTAAIMDVIMAGECQPQLIQLLIRAIRHYRKLGYTAMTTTALNQPLAQALRVLGFSSSPSTHRFMFYARNKPLKEAMNNPQLWEFNLGDTDVI
ncbi:MAG: hypothetical protein CMK83_07375 [Pseudomonadales bacterium]|jgi:hypothetical protein|uniref:hypothetical protein n=1 Tax=unclassified Ketobacter TaxID=2639109 RepID=UPI000C969C2E|nr:MULTISPECIES: hypothetical protein [unclassified Ketobacter]MAA58676.1 hypothetical protein [Pseudomonadales bacterium]MEC8813875.1 hypothetical protein [Pseudomonadota bacterium]TNC90889.1 MAG: hypothetical protein CSH49_00935 [Alcanivorax sp.]HAG92744.1 hypothetical protein [Gammaproteobacteria bacterium]MAQ24027.1 hypothetical protein [Pseudomonadales bacterium]|tara:strand:+ start:12245 stop:13318 length:1074 start_codon:yes stop_codon:yes gene_type:complete